MWQLEGPNFIWHIDGYDKMTPFGFTVHGCIDGYVAGVQKSIMESKDFVYTDFQGK